MAPRLRDYFREVFRLLLMIEPVCGAYDVEWHGPYFVPRRRIWWPSYFRLYGGRVYGAIVAGSSELQVSWDVRSGEFEMERGSRGGYEYADPEEVWAQAAPQLAGKMLSALRNPEVYNLRVARLMPLGMRTGKIPRRLSWPSGVRAPLSPTMQRRAEAAFRRGAEASPLPALSRADFMKTAAVAYDAVFPELSGMLAGEKYRRRADGRDGGLLNLPGDDPAAFKRWYASRQWTGCHPWEIVFAHPHGILLQPVLESEDGWRFRLAVEVMGLYLPAVKMAIALAEAGVPLGFCRQGEVVAALRGVDWVEVGPQFCQVSLGELRRIRPKAVTHVVWDSLPEIRPIVADQRARVRHVLRTGSPAGWEKPSEPTVPEAGLRPR